MSAAALAATERMKTAAVVRRAGAPFLAVREVEARHGFLYVHGGGAVSRALAEAPAGREPARPSSGASVVAERVTPAVLFVTVVLAVVLLVSALLHVLRRLFVKSHNNNAGARAAERHLLFPPHEGGLAQTAIDALPEFAYGEMSAAGLKGKAEAGRPFDCAVCLCEFADDDRLRLIPVCGHAFHVACIDVWLRSSATCPLCRAGLRGIAAAAAADTAVEEQKQQQHQEEEEAAAANDAATSSVVVPVRLGRFKSLGWPDAAEASISASPRLVDGRRCFSMGSSYQYVVSDEQLLVSVHVKNGNAAVSTRTSCSAAAGVVTRDDQHGKKLENVRGGDSFSVSKIWQWRGSQRRLPAGLCADDTLPWAPAASTATTRQERDT